MEIWHEIPGYGGWYEASNQGRIRSWRGHPGRAAHPHVLSLHEANRGGYLTVPLVRDGRMFWPQVNRLVLVTYVGPPPPRASACHRDGNHSNNALGNLFWGTKAEAQRLSTPPKPVVRLSWKQIRRIREMHATGDYSYRELARRYSVSKSTIGRAIRGRGGS